MIENAIAVVDSVCDEGMDQSFGSREGKWCAEVSYVFLDEKRQFWWFEWHGVQRKSYYQNDSEVANAVNGKFSNKKLYGSNK